jgi:acetylornithine deacetylase
MNRSEILKLTEDLIAVPSISGDELAVCERVESELKHLGWSTKRIPIAADRFCVFAGIGTPHIVFSTHLDVVPGKESLFKPHFNNGRLYGRGACDAKGVAATMIAAAQNLKELGRDNFGLLFVVGEEVDGIGALRARDALGASGISWIINGEPTEGKLMRGHKGHLGAEICCKGTACHSGYPALGDDANAKLIRIAHRLLQADWGTDPVLGSGSINLGILNGGLGWNVVSPAASLRCIVRTVGADNFLAESTLTAAVADEATVQILANAPATQLEVFEGFASDIAAFGTDIPNFGPLAKHYVLYGPGSIHVAHTDHESISGDDVESALAGYLKLFELISGRLEANSELTNFSR